MATTWHRGWLVVVALCAALASACIPDEAPTISESLCLDSPPKIDDLTLGSGAAVDAGSKVRLQIAMYPVASDGVSAASSEPASVTTVDYDFPFLRSIGVRGLGTTNQILADAVVPREGEAMRIGGRRRVSIACKHQLFELTVLTIADGSASPFRPAERSDDRRSCWTNAAAQQQAKKGRSGAKPENYPYRRLRDAVIALAVQNPGWAQAIDYGTSVKGCPLTLLRIARDVIGPPPRTRPAILITGAMHGNEYLNIEFALAERLLQRDPRLKGLAAYLEAGGVIFLVPVVNPDGFDADARVNAESEIIGRNDPEALRLDPDAPEEPGNLNRDFAVLPLNKRRFTNPENSSLASYIDDEVRLSRLHLAFSLDYHCCAVGLITPWSYKGEGPRTEDSDDFDLIKNWARGHLGKARNFKVGLVHDVIKEVSVAPGSSIDYYYARYRTRAVAIEGESLAPGKGNGELVRLDQHLDFLNAVLGHIAGGHFR